MNYHLPSFPLHRFFDTQIKTLLMKKLILPLFSLALLISGCSKDKDKAPEEIVLIQEMEFEMGKANFTYNEQNQVTKMQIAMKVEEGVYLPMGYTDFTYSNGLPVTTDFYSKRELNGAYRHVGTTKFAHNGKNIAYAAFVTYDDNGEPELNERDTMFFTFNSNNQLATIKVGTDGDAASLGWDSRGNLLMPTGTFTNGDERITTTYEHSYDNNINPFKQNGLGFLLVFSNLSGIELEDQLLSNNNSVSWKQTEKTEHLVDGTVQGEPVYEYRTITRAITLDENGLLKQVDWKQQTTYSDFEEEETQTRTYKYKCIKKTL